MSAVGRLFEMHEAVATVLDDCHARIAEQRRQPTPGERKEEHHRKLFMAVGPATGRFLNLLVRSLEAPNVLELGTSFGYSTV